MPLVLAGLSAGLTRVFKSLPSSGALFADQFATEYDLYCKAAMAGAALPLFTGAEKQAMVPVLSGAFASPTGVAAVAAQAISMATMNFWLAPPIQFIGGPVMGMVTAAPGFASAIGGITSLLSNTNNTAETIGAGIAGLLDVATKTVLVTFTMPPPPAGPPPPAMVI